METGIEKRKQFNLSEIYDNETVIEIAKTEQLNSILCSKPNDAWVKTNKYANNSKYLPIDKVEFLLRKIFKHFKIEITGQGVAFNGVWVTVRVHYVDPISQEWCYHDGIGAQELQVKQGSSPAQLESINKGALSMAFPIAKSFAVKDACDHFGDIFGANLNRKDTLDFYVDQKIIDNAQKAQEEFQKIIDNK